MRHLTFHKGVFAAALSLFLVCKIAIETRLEGQAVTATILGTVYDASGAAIPGAGILVKNEGTGDYTDGSE